MEKITFPLDSETEKSVMELKEEFYKNASMNSVFSDLISRGLREAGCRSEMNGANETKGDLSNDNHTNGVLINWRL